MSTTKHPIYEAVKWLNYMLEKDPNGLQFLTGLLEPAFKTIDTNLADNSPFQFGVYTYQENLALTKEQPPCYYLSVLGLLNGCFSDNYAIVAVRECDVVRTLLRFQVAKVDPESGNVVMVEDQEAN